jgi:hypothetical protein
MDTKKLDLEHLLKGIRSEIAGFASGGGLSLAKKLKKVLKELKSQGVDDDMYKVLEKRINILTEKVYVYEDILRQRIIEYDEAKRKKNDEEIADIRQGVIDQAKDLQEMAGLTRNKNVLEAIRLQKEMDSLALQIQSLRSHYQQLDEKHRKNLLLVERHDANIDRLEGLFFDGELNEEWQTLKRAA